MLLEIEKLSKVFRGGIKANDEISLSVKAGEIFGLIGPNGAGKTTLVSQIVGIARPTSGKIRIDGVDVAAKPGYVQQVCSFQAQTQVPISGLTAMQAIELVGLIRGGKKVQVRQRAKELVHRLEIDDSANKMGATFSGGMRRLVAFCMAAVVPGRIVILDEPTNDVDPLRRRLLWREVQSLSEMGSAVLLVTHNVLEAERAVNRLAIIDKGKLVVTGTPASLKEHDGEYMRLVVILEPGLESPPAPDFLPHSFTVNRRLVVRVEDVNIPRAIEWARELREKGIAEEFSLEPTSLEDVYMRAVGHVDALEMSEGGASHD
jgi:ABC-2 type transport system ATP-binding protein